MNVERKADGIYHKPQQPLLNILVCQSPQSHYAECRGKGIAHRNGTVGVVGKKPPYCKPYNQRTNRNRQIIRFFKMCNRHVACAVLVVLSAKFPDGYAVDRRKTVVDSHSEVGIQPGLEIQHHVYAGITMLASHSQMFALYSR